MLHFSSCHEFYKKQKIYRMVEVQGMGANPLLVEGQ